MGVLPVAGYEYPLSATFDFLPLPTPGCDWSPSITVRLGLPGNGRVRSPSVTDYLFLATFDSPVVTDLRLRLITARYEVLESKLPVVLGFYSCPLRNTRYRLCCDFLLSPTTRYRPRSITFRYFVSLDHRYRSLGALVPFGVRIAAVTILKKNAAIYS